MILEKHEVAEVQCVDELDETVRGEGGFGSTGVGLGKTVVDSGAVEEESKRVKV